MSNPKELYPLAVLIDELRHDDVSIRLSAMSRVSTIALSLGVERTREELIPFLEEASQEDEDELLVILADELAKFVPLVGGAEHAHCLLNVLASLAACEEPTVRDAASHTLSIVGDVMDQDSLTQYFVPLVRKLTQADWFSSRMSASALYATVLAKMCDVKLLALYRDLVTDDAPMVRRAAATNLPKVIEAVPAAKTEADGPLGDMVSALAIDDQDSVRLLCVDVLVGYIKRFPDSRENPNYASAASSLMGLLSDKSWRVRYMAADRFEQIAGVLDTPQSHRSLIEQFVKLCCDLEAEVRSAIAKRVVAFSNCMTRDELLTDIVPVLEQLTEDRSEHVREALATQISYLSATLGREKTIECLLPLFLQMLRDEHSEVRLQIISNLQVINEVIGIDLLSQSLLPAISELAKDKQWRVLLAIIEYSPLLAEQLGVEFFNKELVPMVLQWLWDPVWAIRDAAASNLVKLSDVFGTEWLETEIVPKIADLSISAATAAAAAAAAAAATLGYEGDQVAPSTAPNYLHRLTALLTMRTLIPALSLQCLESVVLPFISSLSSDPVPNIRFNCAKAFEILASTVISKAAAEGAAEEPKARELVASQIKPVLHKHANDIDVDVRAYVANALRAIEA